MKLNKVEKLLLSDLEGFVYSKEQIEAFIQVEKANYSKLIEDINDILKIRLLPCDNINYVELNGKYIAFADLITWLDVINFFEDDVEDNSDELNDLITKETYTA